MENEEETQNLSNLLKNLLQQFSSVTNPGEKDEHLQECVQNWFSQHERFTEIQIFEHLKQIARNDHDYACLLGFFYDKAFGTPSNLDKAFKWYLRAAEHNDAFGQNIVGYFFMHGYGTKLNYEKAFYWYQKSADNGCNQAKCNIGYCYYCGFHVKRNRRHALYWYSKSAEMHDGLSKCELARMFLWGMGTNADVHRALKLFLEAKNLAFVQVDDYICEVFY
ncbi:6049_t:CDS:1 [Ambispora gerdemannii]|uniref:6049_t:CDS:1 n=1 Tax=Ambispora gerdemannii TaxID=144530 RepID=A0A9N9ALF7_9GLOM|nr:6049_t:CDS:1 [Ambispora gerdemannii]